MCVGGRGGVQHCAATWMIAFFKLFPRYHSIIISVVVMVMLFHRGKRLNESGIVYFVSLEMYF